MQVRPGPGEDDRGEAETGGKEKTGEKAEKMRAAGRVHGAEKTRKNPFGLRRWNVDVKSFTQRKTLLINNMRGFDFSRKKSPQFLSVLRRAAFISM